MNYTHLEILAELNRQRIREQIAELHIQEEANSHDPNRVDLFSSVMFRLANWMVAVGTSLRQRYEKSCLECPQPGSGNLATGRL
jgi:hypothetical protein